MRALLHNTSRCLFLLLFLLPTAGYAQDNSEEPPGLFNVASEARAQALSAVGQERLETLQHDAPTQSIRLVRMVDSLSQRRSLVMHWDGQAVEPDVQPAFARTPAAQDDAQNRRNRPTTLFIQRDTIKAIEGVTFAWSGTVYANPGDRTKLGEVILIHGEDRHITGSISIEGEFYHIRPLSGSWHALVEDDESKYPSGGDPRDDGKADPRNDGGALIKHALSDVFSKVTTTSSEAAFASTEQACAASVALDGVDIEGTGPKAEHPVVAPCWEPYADVLVVYTEDAASGRDINGIINLAIQQAENAYDNSNIDGYWTNPGSVALNLAHSQQVSFDETGNMTNDMNNLVANSTIQSLRNQHDADIVVLLTNDVYSGIAGRAREIRAEAADAYAIVEAPAASGGNYTFVHEVGHLQGAQHNPEAPTCTPGTSCDTEGDLFSDAFGHYFTASGNRRRTVMSYDRYPGYSRILHFSNPSVTYNGTATGTSSRNNAAALKTTSDAVEYFRTSDLLEAKFSYSGDPNGGVRFFDANPCGGTGSYSYEWRISYYGPFNYGSPVSTQETFTHIFPEGTHYVKLTVTSGSQTDIDTKALVIDCEPGHQCGGPSVASMQATASPTASEQALASSQPEEMEQPKQVALHAVAPNPVRTSTAIRYDLPEPAEVELTVYDLMGREVKRLATGSHGQGTHSVQLDATTLPSGVYLVRLQAGSRQLIRRITVVK